MKSQNSENLAGRRKTLKPSQVVKRTSRQFFIAKFRSCAKLRTNAITKLTRDIPLINHIYNSCDEQSY